MPASISASRPVGIAEHFRMPYENSLTPLAAGVAHIAFAGAGHVLWPVDRGPGAMRIASIESAQGSIPIFVDVLSDPEAQALLGKIGGNWQRTASVTGERGEHLGSIWRARNGSVFLPFDPDEVRHNYLSERYVELIRGTKRGPGRAALLRAYYRTRVILPRRTQIWIRRWYARIQAQATFPGWPAETGLHDFLDLFLSILAGARGEGVPYIAPWPKGYAWAMVLTHDVETWAGLRALDPVLEIERALGLRSSWNFVPRRYDVSDELVRDLVADGFEVGVHGLYHDGRDLSSLPGMLKRLPMIHEAAERWGAVGFRSPASHRNWDWMPQLGFDYDSSYPDTDPFEPQPGGCCSWWPFFNQDMVELPLTMPHDHTLFVILSQHDERSWVEKAEVLRRRAGMALIVTHPDYLLDRVPLEAYRRFLERYVGDPTVWRALPAEVSKWWRSRAATSLRRDGGDLSLTGPARDQAAVAVAEARPWC